MDHHHKPVQGHPGKLLNMIEFILEFDFSTDLYLQNRFLLKFKQNLSRFNVQFTSATALLTFRMQSWNHFTNFGMDSIAYLANPEDSIAMTSITKSHSARYTIQSDYKKPQQCCLYRCSATISKTRTTRIVQQLSIYSLLPCSNEYHQRKDQRHWFISYHLATVDQDYSLIKCLKV